eukprot:symbB.v1.2.040029.t1/scaffold6946.1/size14339/1
MASLLVRGSPEPLRHSCRLSSRPPRQVVPKMVTLALRCSSTGVMKIGKCKGLTYQQCLAQQPQYCTWLLQRKSLHAQPEYEGFLEFLSARSSFVDVEAVPCDDASAISVMAETRQGLRMDRPQPREVNKLGFAGPLAGGQWRMTLGKHGGSSFAEVYSADLAYCEHVVNKVLNFERVEVSSRLSLEYCAFAAYVLHNLLQELQLGQSAK